MESTRLLNGMSNWKNCCRDISPYLGGDEIWRIIRVFYLRSHVSKTHWQLSRWGGRDMPERISLLFFDLGYTYPRALQEYLDQRQRANRRRRNLHMLTGRYPEDFTHPEPNEGFVPVYRAWWVPQFALVDDITAFYLWLIDGFPIYIDGRSHRQVLPADVQPGEDIAAYFLGFLRRDCF